MPVEESSGERSQAFDPVLVADLLTLPSIERMQQRFLDVMAARPSSFAVGVYLHDRVTGRPATLEVRGLGSYYVHRYELYGRDQDPVVRRAVTHREVCDSDALMPYTEWLDLPVVRDVFLPHDMARVLCAPLVVDGEVVGTLNLARNHEQPCFSDSDRQEAAVAAHVFGAGVSSLRRQHGLERERAHLVEALDACDTAVVITDLRLAQRYYNAPARDLLDGLGQARVVVERMLDCDGPERTASLDLPSGSGAPSRLTVRSHQPGGADDVVVSTIVVADPSAVRIPASCRALLTGREADVVTGVLAGRRDTEIAAELLMSPNTVKHHLKSVYSKLGVHSRAELVQRLLH